ncbi:MAG: hypothetical protein K6G50_10200 [bacterium]|nr:hypothetical protein [bacterium]
MSFIPVAQPSAYKDYPIPDHKPRRHRKNRRRQVKWGSVCVLLAILAAALFVIAKIIGALVSWIFPGSSPFDNMFPADIPFAVEGTGQEVAAFLNDHISPEEQKAVNTASFASSNARVIFARLSQSGSASSQACRSNIMDVVNTIEDSWCSEMQYPKSLPPMPPCPAGGKLSYSTDGDSFVLTCQSDTHKTVYSSNEGLPETSCKTSSLAIVMEPQSGLSGFFGKHKTEVLSANKDEAETYLANFKKSGQKGLTLEGPANTPLRFTGSAEQLSNILPSLDIKLPKYCRFSIWKDPKTNVLSLRAKVSEKDAWQDDTNALAIFKQLQPSASAVAGSAEFFRRLSVWPADLDCTKDCNPVTFGIAAESVLPDNEISGTLSKALAGRTNAQIITSFTSTRALENWMKASGWNSYASANSPMLTITAENTNFSAKIGRDLKTYNMPALPKGPGKANACGRIFTSAHVNGKEKVKEYMFTAGITGDTLWAEIACAE